MSIKITIVSNVTVTKYHSLWIFCQWAMVSVRRLRQSDPPHLLLPYRFLPGFFVAWAAILHRPCVAVIWLFAKDKAILKKIIYFLLAHCWSVLISLFCLYIFTVFFTVLPLRNDTSKAAVIFLISEETKFEVDTTSIILSYLYHFGNVKKEFFRYF